MLDLLPAGLPAPTAGWFSTRGGGVSAPPYDGLNLAVHVQDEWRRVHANRELLSRAAGVQPEHLVFMQQVHGADVTVVDGSSSRRRNGGAACCDALVTVTPGIGLVVLAADCLPVLLADAAAGVVAVAHAGRQGLVAGVLQRTVEVMTGLGAGQILATIGPAACGRCYELPEVLADEVGAVVPGSRATTRSGTPSADLTAGALGILRAAGVTATAVGGCTVEQPDRFFSYRRDGRTGRHAGVVRLDG